MPVARNQEQSRDTRIGELLTDVVTVAAARRELVARLRTACLVEDRDAVLALARVLTGIDPTETVASDGGRDARTESRRR